MNDPAPIIAIDRQCGVGLIEVLVALLVLGIGVLGTVALETSGIGYSRTSVERAQAVSLIDSMAERIRDNPIGAQSGDYGSIDTRTVSAPSVDCAAGACSASDIAAYDAWQWRKAITYALASGYGTVSWISADPQVYLLTVFWKEGGAIAANAACPVDPAHYCLRAEVRVVD